MSRISSNPSNLQDFSACLSHILIQRLAKGIPLSSTTDSDSLGVLQHIGELELQVRRSKEEIQKCYTELRTLSSRLAERTKVNIHFLCFFLARFSRKGKVLFASVYQSWLHAFKMLGDAVGSGLKWNGVHCCKMGVRVEWSWSLWETEWTWMPHKERDRLLSELMEKWMRWAAPKVLADHMCNCMAACCAPLGYYIPSITTAPSTLVVLVWQRPCFMGTEGRQSLPMLCEPVNSGAGWNA